MKLSELKVSTKFKLNTFIFASLLFLALPSFVQAKNSMDEFSIKKQKLAAINQSLKALAQENVLSGDDEYIRLKSERDELVRSMGKAHVDNREYARKVSGSKKISTSVEESENLDDIFEVAAVRTQDDVQMEEEKALDLLGKIDAFAEQDERLRTDAAKAHYNMGNIYFQKGEFEIAAREYYQAVVLMPDDPDAHYNLAFVSGEYLKDQRVALKHYQMYLYLKPNAKDAHKIKEKIVNAKLLLRSIIDSPIEMQK